MAGLAEEEITDSDLTFLKARRGMTLIELSVVLLVITMVMGILVWMLRSFATLRSTADEAEALSQVYTFARRSAIKSGDTVYLEINLDDESYLVYRIDRSGRRPEKKTILDRRALSSRNSIVAVVSPLGGRINSGTVTLPFLYDGTTEEVSIYLGPDPAVDKTVHFPRFSAAAIIEEGETLPESMPGDDGNAREKDRLEEK
jgi:prepilin-type N-terminal cleavage/methylation domain-containing protein